MWEFDEPDAVGGDRLNPKDCVGHLLMVWACDYIDHHPTKFTKPGDKADVIVVDAVDLDQADENGYQGALFRRCWWRQARLIGALRGRVGKENPLLGRIQMGQATMGNAPYELVSATSDKESVERAYAWARAHPDFAPSFKQAQRSPEWTQGSLRDPSPVEQRAAQAAGVTDYLNRLAASSSGQAQRLSPPPPPPPQDADPPF